MSPAVTQEYLDTIDPVAVVQAAQADLQAALQADLQAGLPDWDPSRGGLLRRALPGIALFMATRHNTSVQQWRATLLPYAEGDDLDAIGVTRGVPREGGEADDPYRLRIANHVPNPFPVTLEQFDGFIRSFDSTITDTQTVIAANRKDLTIYALKGTTALTAAELATLETYLDDAGRKIAGTAIVVAATTEVVFNVVVEVKRRAITADDQIVNTGEAALNAWATTLKIGHGVYQSAIIDAAFVADALDVVVTAPASDLAAADGQLYAIGTVTVTTVVT